MLIHIPSKNLHQTECEGCLRSLELVTATKKPEHWEIKITTDLSRTQNLYLFLTDYEIESLVKSYQDELALNHKDKIEGKQ